jgi:hypothetical protein
MYITQSLLTKLDELKYWGTLLDPTAVEEARAASSSLKITRTRGYGEDELHVQVEEDFAIKFSLSVGVEIENASRRIIHLGSEPVRLVMPWSNFDFRLLPADEARALGFYKLAPCGRQFPIDVVVNHRLVAGRALRPGQAMEGLLLGEGTASTSLDFSERESVPVQLVINTERGETCELWVELRVNRFKIKQSAKNSSIKKRGRIFEKKDPVPVVSAQSTSLRNSVCRLPMRRHGKREPSMAKVIREALAYIKASR